MGSGAPTMKVRFAVAPGGGSSDDVDLLAFAEVLEASGFDGIWLSDVPLAATVDPLLGLAQISGRTARIRLGANLVPLGRNPFLLAKGLAHLDQLSGGRLLLNFVPGLDRTGERELLGTPGISRGAALEQTLRLVRSWWAGDAVEPASNHSLLTLPPAARPVQDPLEVWLGGRAPSALERAGRIADGWLGAMLTPAEAQVAQGRIQDSAARSEREIDPEHFGLSVRYARARPEPEVLDGLRRTRADIDPLAVLPVGAPALRSLISEYVDAGLSKFVVRSAVRVLPDAYEEELEWLGATILDLQS
jgi:probable F420-dependent oxidoreductase